MSTALPSTSTLFTREQLVERHPNLLTDSRMKWALRNRESNGLKGYVYEARSGELLIDEPAFLRWFLGLEGRSKPRSSKRSARKRDAA